MTPKQKQEDAQRRAQQRFDDENRRISEAFIKKRKEEARQRAMKNALARARRTR